MHQVIVLPSKEPQKGFASALVSLLATPLGGHWERPLLARWGCRFGGWLQNLAVAQQALVHEAMQRFGGLQVRCRIPMRKMKDPANSNVASVDGCGAEVGAVER